MIEAHPWNEKLDLAHEAMDHEHHLQIALVSAFVDALEQARPWLARRLAEQLASSSVAHFDGEELLMDAAAYPDRDRHAAEHVLLLARIREVEAAYAGGEERAALDAALELREALARHVGEADRRLVAHVARRG